MSKTTIFLIEILTRPSLRHKKATFKEAFDDGLIEEIRINTEKVVHDTGRKRSIYDF